MSQDEALEQLEKAVRDYHQAVKEPDDHRIVTGWIVPYMAIDGDGGEIVNYVAGNGTTLTAAVGMLHLIENVLKNGGAE